MLEFIIIGGGIHGTYISNLLVSDLGWSTDSIKVIDPYDCACGRWKELTARTGMRVLRSPMVHHLGVPPWELRHFQRSNASQSWATSTGSKQRPSLTLFNKHIDQLCEEEKLLDLRVKAEALAVEKVTRGLRVKTTSGDFEAKRVVLAISSNDKLKTPSWATEISSIAKHIFQPDFSFDLIKPGQKIAIVGGGITAAQVALRLAAISPGNVTLITRETLKVAEFDSDPCWMGPKCLSLFAAEKSYAKRRALIKGARNKGTVTPEVYREIRRAEQLGNLKVVIREVEFAQPTWNDQATLVDAYGNNLCHVSHVIMATGFESGRPGGALLDQIISSFDMPVAPDGFPIVDKTLHWKDQLYVTGALAELEVGPPARNILGARLAGERLKRAFGRHPWDFSTALVASSLYGFAFNIR